MMPILHSSGVMTPGQFGPTSRLPLRRTTSIGPDHVEHGHALGDRDDGLDPGVDGLEDRVGRERRRHEDHRGIGPGRLDRLDHRVENRQPLDLLAAPCRA